ncbi:Synaptic vesicle glycoprotein 2C [Collichthys lucidus]|uniref:Synaptic vesicle glycoprotein 2C n=1 Tax=Collichthys lucidus TaxID=240159 RepID=A0A4U5VBJ6_COLLU|nr:Synaptic vesicle glycoprotein 2C [Collichthys lucidus]
METDHPTDTAACCYAEDACKTPAESNRMITCIAVTSSKPEAFVANCTKLYLQDRWSSADSVLVLCGGVGSGEERRASELAVHVLDDRRDLRLGHGLGHHPTLRTLPEETQQEITRSQIEEGAPPHVCTGHSDILSARAALCLRLVVASVHRFGNTSGGITNVVVNGAVLIRYNEVCSAGPRPSGHCVTVRLRLIKYLDRALSLSGITSQDQRKVHHDMQRKVAVKLHITEEENMTLVLLLYNKSHPTFRWLDDSNENCDTAVQESELAVISDMKLQTVTLHHTLQRNNQGWSFSMGSAYQFHSWRVFVVVCALPCVSAVVALTFMPESPRFFLEMGKHDEAWMVLKHIHDTNMRARGEPERVFTCHQQQQVTDRCLPLQVNRIKIPKQLDELVEMPNESANPVVKVLFKIKAELRGIWLTFMRCFNYPVRDNTIKLAVVWFTLSFGFYGLSVWFPDVIKHLQADEYASRVKIHNNERIEDFTFNFTLENQIHRNGLFLNDRPAYTFIKR